METFLQDLRYCIRILAKNRVLTVVAILSMALGIGATTAVFSAVNAVLFKSLPYADLDRLVLVWGNSIEEDNGRNQVSATDIADYRSQNSVFEDITTYTGWVPLFTGYGEAERVPAIQVGDGFFNILKGKAMLGRTFLPEEQEEGKDFVIVLSHGLWQRKFGSDPQIVSKTVHLNSRSYVVVGVMPPEFHPLPPGLVSPVGQFYRPVAEAYDNTQRDARHLRGIARLKPGVSVKQAQAEMSMIAKRLEQQYPGSNTMETVNVVPLAEDTVGGVRRSLWILFGAVTFVLLVACANVSNLLLAQSSARQREITLRAALGASRRRLVRQLLTESLMLAVAGGALGLLLAYWSMGAISSIGSQAHYLLESVALDGRVLLFTLAMSLISGLLFGMAPSWHASRTDLAESLRSGVTHAASPAATRLRGALVSSEIAITLVLLMCAALFLQTVMRLRQVDPGFNPKNLLTLSIGLPFKRFPEKKDWILFYAQAAERLAALPGVVSAGVTSVLPMSDNFDGRGIEVEDRPVPEGQEISADLYVATPDYLRTMEIPVVRGRGITTHDTEDSFQVALVNQTMARKLWPAKDPLGKRIRFSPKDPWRTIVGVVKDVQQYGLDRTPPMQFYLPHSQFPTLFNSIVVKTQSDPLAFAGAVRSEIRAIDPQQAVFNLITMEEWISDSIALRRILMMLLLSLAAVALGMAAVGIYGVMSYSVAQRTREIGIRMALGAGRSSVFQLVVRQGMALTIAGIVIGAMGAVAVTRLISGLLFETSPLDPQSFLLVSLTLAAVSIAACLAPARRAAALDPMSAIRYE